MRFRFAAALALAIGTFAAAAAADRNDPTTTGPRTPDRVGPGSLGQTESEAPSRWQGSVLIFDQSATTQTFGVGSDYLSSNQSYELWWSLRPRYALYTSDTTTLALSVIANLYWELTNNDGTTTEHEPLLGSTIVAASLSHTLFERGEYKTSFSVAPRVTLPTDRESRDAGRYFTLGASAGLSQAVPLNGREASAFNGLRFGVAALYGHPFNRAIVRTSTDPNVADQPRQVLGAPRDFEIAGRPVGASFESTSATSDQLSGGLNVKDTLGVSFSAGAQLAPKLGLGLSYLIGSSWTYWAVPQATVPLSTGSATVQGIENATNYRVSTWALASLDYDAFDEASISLGYYNQTNQIGPDGERRSPLWSPDARIFLSITGNLDIIYDRITPKRAPAQTATAR